MKRTTILKDSVLKKTFDRLQRDFILIASDREVKTAFDFFHAATIKKIYNSNGGRLAWNNYGGSVNKNTEKELIFLITCIFKNCNYFYLIPREKYEKKLDSYFTMQAREREKLYKSGFLYNVFGGVKA